MAAGLTECEHCAQCSQLRDDGGTIRDALAGGDTKTALNEALAALQSAAATLRKRVAGRGARTDAELAGSIYFTALHLHLHLHATRRGRRRRAPSPAELLAVFEDSMAKARKEAEATEEAERR